MEEEDWFPGWVQNHCIATGADAATMRTILANREIITERWSATVLELGDVTVRLVERGMVPKFANEHTEAIRLELVRLREERSERPIEHPGDFAPDCLACGGSGLAVVPHPRCVWQRRLVLHPEHKRVITVAVLCDRQGCDAGRVARDKENSRKGDVTHRATLSQAERHHQCDLVALMREYESESARRARDGQPRDLDAVPNLAAILTSIGQRVPGKRGAA